MPCCPAWPLPPQLHPEGYTELLGCIVISCTISCTGGPVLQVGTAVPTTNITIYRTSFASFTNRYMGPGATGYGSSVSDAGASRCR